MNYRDITKEDIEKAYEEFFGKEDESFIGIKNTQWTDEEGNHYSMWDLGNGVVTGAEMFQKLLQETYNKSLKNG